MRYGLFADVHGNLDALEVVLEELSKESLDSLYCLGDIVGYGAEPAECVERVKDLGCVCVAGNHDHAVLGKTGLEFFNPHARKAVEWTRLQLSDKHRFFLSRLSLIELVNDFTIVHSTPKKPAQFDYVQTPFDAHLCFRACSTQLCFIGHSHIPVTFRNADPITFSRNEEFEVENGVDLLVNIGSVGQPRDNNPHAAYCIWDTEQQIIQIKRVEYDTESASEKIRQAGLPEILSNRILVGV